MEEKRKVYDTGFEGWLMMGCTLMERTCIALAL